MRRSTFVWISVLLAVALAPLSAAAEGAALEAALSEPAVPEIGEVEILAPSEAEDPAAPEEAGPSVEGGDAAEEPGPVEGGSAAEEPGPVEGGDAAVEPDPGAPAGQEAGETDVPPPEDAGQQESVQEFPALRLGLGEKTTLEVGGTAFSSSDTAVATVNRKGAVRAKGKGRATITVFADGEVIGTCRVQVVKAPSRLRLSCKALKMTAGQTGALEAKLARTAASRIRWTSSNAKVATVDQEGVVTALKYGTAQITAKTYNGIRASCVVSVKNPPVEVGSAPVIDKRTGTYNKRTLAQTYTYIDLSNAIPYVYYARGHFRDVVREIENHSSNILVIANAYLGNGPIISNKVGFPSAKSATTPKHTLVVDVDGNVGYSPMKVSNEDLLSDRISCIDGATGEKTDDWKVASAVCGWGYFYLNGRENFTFKNPRTSRQRQFLGVNPDGTFTLFTMSKDGRNGKGWGWNGEDMINIVRKHHCASAYNFDGGNSTATAWRFDKKSRFSLDIASGDRSARGFLVFTSDNRPPYVR